MAQKSGCSYRQLCEAKEERAKHQETHVRHKPRRGRRGLGATGWKCHSGCATKKAGRSGAQMRLLATHTHVVQWRRV